MCSRSAGETTWSLAVRACSNFRAELPYPSSASDYRQLTNHVEEHYSTSSFFLGFSDSEYEGVWKTEGSVVKFKLETLWDQQKPGGKRGDDYMISSKRRKNTRWLLSDVDNEYEATAICLRDRERQVDCGWSPRRTARDAREWWEAVAGLAGIGTAWHLEHKLNKAMDVSNIFEFIRV